MIFRCCNWQYVCCRIAGGICLEHDYVADVFFSFESMVSILRLHQRDFPCGGTGFVSSQLAQDPKDTFSLRDTRRRSSGQLPLLPGQRPKLRPQSCNHSTFLNIARRYHFWLARVCPRQYSCSGYGSLFLTKAISICWYRMLFAWYLDQTAGQRKEAGTRGREKLLQGRKLRGHRDRSGFPLFARTTSTLPARQSARRKRRYSARPVAGRPGVNIYIDTDNLKSGLLPASAVRKEI